MSTPTAPGRRALADALRRDLVPLTEAVVRRIRDDVQEYREEVSPEVIEQLAESVREHLRIYIEILESDGHQQFEESRFAFAHDAARRRAQQGVSSESLIRSFSSATSAIWSWLVQNDWLADQRVAIVRDGWPLWFEYINDAAARVTTVYRRIEMERFEDEVAVRANFLESLLDHKLGATEGARAMARFGVEPDSSLVLVMFRTPDDVGEDTFERDRRLVKSVVARLESVSGTRPFVLLRDGEIVLMAALRGRSPEQVRSALAKVVAKEEVRRGPISGVVSQELKDVMDVPGAYASCYRALKVLEQQPRLALLTEISVLDFAAAALGADIKYVSPEPMVRFIGSVSQDHPDWLETIDAWVANSLNVKQTATAMHVHVNTVYYRLGQISKATGVDVYDLGQVVGLVIAVRLRRYLV